MPQKKHDFTKTEVAAGAMVILSVAVFVLFIAVVQGLRPPQAVTTLYAFFNNTAGLNVGGDVRFGGVKAGRVVAIEPDSEDQSRVRVVFGVKPTFPINQESRAFITQVTLTSEPHLEVSTGTQEAARLADGDEVPVDTAKGGGMFGGIDQIAASLAPVLEDVIALLGVEELEQTAAKDEEEGELVTIADLFSNVNGAIVEGGDLVKDVRGVVSDRSDEVGAVLTKLQEVGDEAKRLVTQLNGILAENREDLRGTVEASRKAVGQVGAMIDDLASRMDALASALHATLENTEGLTGETRAMVEANRPVIEDLLLDLRETVRHLQNFSRTIAEEPESIIRGKAAHGRK